MDKSVLLEKRKSLITSNKGAAELFLNSGCVDMLNLLSYDELLNFVENPATSQLVINKTSMLDHIKTVISDIKNIDDISKSVELLGFAGFKYNKDNDLEKTKTDLINKLSSARTDILQNLLEGSLTAKIKYYDTSIWTYFLSYGILEGAISYTGNEDLIVRAPLINIEIEVIKTDNGELIIRKISNEQIANEILELSLNMQLDKTTNLAFAIDKEFFSSNEYFNYISTVLPNLEINIQPSEFIKMSRESIISAKPSLRIRKSFCVCSINPIGGKMLRDYDEVVSSEYQFPIYDTIFHKDLNHLIYDQDQIYQINNPLNLVQKLSIINALNKNVLVYGPPGTGKSEVVANLIANLLMDNKSCLIISEKKAALDVLEQRLLSLNALSMSAFNEKNSNVFYKKIIELNHLIVSVNKVNVQVKNEQFLNLLKYQHLLKQIAKYKDINGRNIDYFVQKYASINLTLYKRNIDIIKFIFNKLAVDKIKLDSFIKNIMAIREIQTYLDSVFGVDKVNNDSINHKRVKEFVTVLEKIPEKDKAFIIRKFLVENQILSKKPMFQLRTKLDDTLDVDKLMGILNQIIDDEIYFVVNNRKIFSFIQESANFQDYVSLYDWLTNTEWQKFVDIFNGDMNSQALIQAYWDYQILNTKKMDEIIRDVYINNLKAKLLANHDVEIKWTELLRKANLSNRPNINKVIKEYYDVLKVVFPIWVLSPDAAVAIVPLKRDEFDYGIFDEASQMRIEKGIPLIYRCRFAMVSGDDKQLKPTSFFERANTLDETFDGHLDNVDSLLDKAKSSNWMSFTLSNHYRSVNEQLIRYSSHHFYNDELICITKNGCFKKAIEVFEENGVYDRENGVNPTEANKVIQYLLTTLNQYESVIVITFNVKQADLIQQLAMSKAELATKLENLTLKIRSLENVQGDEADLVLISCTFGKDAGGRFLQNFGPVNQDGGMNRINVMITRAKDKMVVVKSFKSEDINNITNENTNIFKGFLSYVEQIQTTNTVVEQIDAISTIGNSIIESLYNQFKSNTEWVIEKYKKVGSHIMDLAISKVGNQKISLCVLLDDEIKLSKYTNDSRQWVQQIDRQKYYEDRGYRTYRINCIEWYINSLKLIHKIQAEIV